MKKITFYLMMLLSLTAFAQIEVIENFDDTTNNQVPAGWTETNFGATSSFSCDGSAKAMSTGATGATSETLTTPDYLAISNGTDLTASFSYNIFEQFSQFPPPNFVAPATGWGSIELEYSVDNGVNWINITTINDSSFTFTGTANCGSVSVNVGTITNGSDFQARFVVTTSTITNFALWVIIDNVSFTQVATTTPNCDAILLDPANGSNTAESDVTLNWQAATGLPTGYTVSVGTTTGGTDIVNADTTSTPSYDLSGLTYETEYFVNIVPYNGQGNATGCIEESFTTRVAPIAGASCSSPIVVNSFPYLVMDDTDLYEDNFDSSPCSNSYMNGKDVFYEITPVSDMSVNIELTGVDDNGASIHVVEGCVDTATNCVAYVGTYSASAVRLLEEVVLLAGNTYFVVLSNSSNTRTYGYTLLITQNSCINPSMTLSPVADCGNGQFSVDVDVTYMGDATSLTLADDFGNSNPSINATGVVNFGPYPSGSTVNFSLIHNQDGMCSYGDSTFLYCPPTNDECGAPIALAVNTDGTCTIFTSATNAGATDSVGDPAACSGNTNDVWFSFVADGSSMVLEYLNVVAAIGSGGTVQATELLEGSCGSLTSLACITGNYVEFNGLTNGNTYYIRNKTNLAGAYAQNYDICLKTPPAPPVNDECSNATALTLSTDSSCDNQIMGTTIGATVSAENACNTSPYKDVWYVYTPTTTGYYEFSYERLITSPTSYYVVYEGSCGALTQKSSSCSSNANQILNLTSGQSYYIMVRSSNTGPGIDFNLCLWQLPPAVSNSECSSPDVLLESSNSNGDNMISGSLDNSYNSPEGCSSSTYESIWYTFTPSLTGMHHIDFTRLVGSAYYTVFNTDNCANTGDGYVSGITSCYNSGDKTVDMIAGTTYLIKVHASVSTGTTFELFAYADPSLGLVSNEFDTFKYFPNPVRNILTVEARSSISNVSIHNMVGQEIRTLAPNSLNAKIDMSELNGGVYFVTVTIKDSRKTIKVIKE